MCLSKMTEAECYTVHGLSSTAPEALISLAYGMLNEKHAAEPQKLAKVHEAFLVLTGTLQPADERRGDFWESSPANTSEQRREQFSRANPLDKPFNTLDEQLEAADEIIFLIKKHRKELFEKASLQIISVLGRSEMPRFSELFLTMMKQPEIVKEFVKAIRKCQQDRPGMAE